MDFKSAHIKVWMLTGDKRETAKNIAISCGLIDKSQTDPELIIDGMDQQTLQKQFQDAREQIQVCDENFEGENDNRDQTTLISGTSLSLILNDADFSENFSYLIHKSSCIVVFRSSPDEKA